MKVSQTQTHQKYFGKCAYTEKYTYKYNDQPSVPKILLGQKLFKFSNILK